MKQNQLAQIAGITPKHVSDLKCGNRNFTIEMTILFEQITGIPREKWAYPEKHGDPWKELKNIPPPEEERRKSGSRRKNTRRQADDRRCKVRRKGDCKTEQCLPPV